jgi:dihydrofolate reductase
MVKLIVAHDENRVIGNDGEIPWTIKDDMRHFKETTTGHIVIMGNGTFESMACFCLPNRINVVISRNPEARLAKFKKYYASETPPQFRSDFIAAVEEYKKSYPDKDIFIIGGGEIYAYALQKILIDEIIVSLVEGTHVGDAYFPELSNVWTKTSTESRTNFKICKYRQHLPLFSQ